MAETYCGKTCTECAMKEELKCPGCKLEPGRPITGDCALARCCREKSHETCATCNLNGHCNTFYIRHQMPQRRLKEREAAREREQAIARKAPFLGKWIWILFWLVVPSTLFSILAEDSITGSNAGLNLWGNILLCVCNLVYGGILLKLSAEDAGFTIAGICMMVGSLINGILNACYQGNLPGWTLILTIPAAVVSLVGAYMEFHAYADTLTGLDVELAEKWQKLWKWTIAAMGAMVGSLILILIAPILGLLLTLAGAVASIVTSVLKLVYLYQTAQTFRDIPPIAA